MTTRIVLGAAAIALSLGAASAQARRWSSPSWGGTTQDAQKQAWAKAVHASDGIAVLQDGPTDYGKLKAMVESGNVSWDVVDVEHDFAIKAAADGLPPGRSISRRSTKARSIPAS